MNKAEKILDLKNGVEANLFSAVLEENNIPHMVKSNSDMAFDGIYQSVSGWGHLEAPPEYREQILSLYNEFSRKEFIEEEDEGNTGESVDPNTGRWRFWIVTGIVVFISLVSLVVFFVTQTGQ
ncbi:MAG: hypothetical protein JW969_06770 [Spirochaetales bacterium]|nr:hypothetical protein [Spirochaetales bacterium]